MLYEKCCICEQYRNVILVSKANVNSFKSDSGKTFFIILYTMSLRDFPPSVISSEIYELINI